MLSYLDNSIERRYYSITTMLAFMYGLSSKERVFFARRLAFLVGSGTPLLESVRMIYLHTKSKSKARIFRAIMDDIESGKNLSHGMAQFERSFGRFAINVVRAGEVGGILHQNLSYLADELEKREELKKKIVGALCYPLFIVGATGLTAGLLITFIFPKLTPVFNSLNIELPFMTSLLVYATDFLLRYSTVIALSFMMILCTSYILYRRFKKVKRFGEYLFYQMPFLGVMMRTYHCAAISRTIGILLESNMRVMQAITIASETSGSILYREALERVVCDISEGRTPSKKFAEEVMLFDPLMAQMIAVGEISGNLSQTFLYLACFFERELDHTTKNLTHAIEPTLMILMGLIVGYVVLSIITPIYGVTERLTI